VSDDPKPAVDIDTAVWLVESYRPKVTVVL
jgi:hypothetical protein